jgi:hypothetical protein
LTTGDCINWGYLSIKRAEEKINYKKSEDFPVPTANLTTHFGELTENVQSIDHDKIHARNSIYAHAQDFAMNDELLLAILKAFIPQQVNKQHTIRIMYLHTHEILNRL